MHVAVLTLGTRGDVQPSVALALKLEAAGHTVRFGAPPRSRELVTSRGLDFTPLGGLPPSPKPVSALSQLGQTLVTVTKFLVSFVRPGSTPEWPGRAAWLEPYMDDSWQACQGADAIIFPAYAFWVPHIAEKLRVPCFLVDIHPFTPTRAFPSFLFESFLPKWLTRWGRLNGLSHHLVRRLFFAFGLRLSNRWRREKLGLPPWSTTKPLAKFYCRQTPFFYAYSPAVVARPDDWPRWHHVTGWWYLDRPENWTPPPELVDFLAAGPPPVCVGFGSVADRNPGRLTRIVLDGIALSGQRAVLLTGWGGLDATDVPETVFKTDSIPHDWLFPRMAAVVTHGGSGTVGAALRAGIPAVVVPCWNDQPFWANRLHEMGVSPRPIPKRRLSPARLAAAIDAAVHDQQIRERAAEVARQIASEDGVARAMEAFEEYVRRRRG